MQSSQDTSRKPSVYKLSQAILLDNPALLFCPKVKTEQHCSQPEGHQGHMAKHEVPIRTQTYSWFKKGQIWRLVQEGQASAKPNNAVSINHSVKKTLTRHSSLIFLWPVYCALVEMTLMLFMSRYIISHAAST